MPQDAVHGGIECDIQRISASVNKAVATLHSYKYCIYLNLCGIKAWYGSSTMRFLKAITSKNRLSYTSKRNNANLLQLLNWYQLQNPAMITHNHPIRVQNYNIFLCFVFAQGSTCFSFSLTKAGREGCV